MIDGGYLTAPNSAVFDPINNRFIAENEGVPPDIEVLLDAWRQLPQSLRARVGCPSIQ